MISDTTTSERIDQAPEPVPTLPSLAGRQRLIATLVIVALGALGLVMVSTGSDTNVGQDVEGSSSLDFLQPDATASGPVRIKYESPTGIESVENGGVVPLSDDLQLEVSTNPYPPTSFDVDVELYLTDAAGQPVPDARIIAVWDMIVMWHGPFETEFTNLGDGRYRARLDLFMFGPWELLTHVTAPGHDTPDPLTLSIYTWPE